MAVLSGTADTRRLVDLNALGWTSLEVGATHFGVGATCTVAELYAFVPPDNWRASPLIRVSCEYFLSSFKVWNSATVGGNICMSLPAGPMITLAVCTRGFVHTMGYRRNSEDRRRVRLRDR